MKNRPTFDEIFMNLAISVSEKSHCIRRKVGAVISKENRIISIGYNGPPSKTYNCDEIWPKTGCKEKEFGGCFFAIHAEENAIIYAYKQKSSLKGSTIYSTLSPCLSCAKLIFSAEISKIIYLNLYSDYKSMKKEEGLDFLNEFGVITEKFIKE
jgi:dCMP deaminase